MPELPEVETIRRRLAPLVEGRTLRSLEILDPRWCEPLAPQALRDALEGRTIERLGRRGKYLDLRGRRRGLPAHAPAHDRHAALRRAARRPLRARALRARRRRPPASGSGHVVSFCDPRRFGTGQLALGGPQLDAFLDARLGVEPLGEDFTTEQLYLQTRNRRAPIKAVLLDQRRIAGVGNIYANEALFRARIHPLREAGRLKRAQVAALRDAVVASLRGRPRRGRGHDRRLPPPRRRQGRVSERVPRARPRRRAVPRLRHGDPQVRRGRARDLRVRDLPAAPARPAAPRRGAAAIRG